MSPERPALGYYWGDDEYELDRAVDRLASRMTAAGNGEPVERWRVRGDQASPADLAERVGTAPFFGGGTLAVVSDPTGLGRSRDDVGAVIAALGTVAPGNGLAFVETLDGFGRRPAMLEALSAAVAAAGGEVREVRAPTEGRMVRWIEERAAERGLRFGRGAAQELATRVGAFVREGDVDRSRQGRLAVSELDKLQLYRPAGEVSTDDVRALVPEAIPGSIWGFLDALAERRTGIAVDMAERLVQTQPAPVLLAVIHRRIRELIQVADLVATGATGSEIVKTLKIKPYPAEKLVKHARSWTLDDLEAALSGLLELDVAIKGSDGQAVSEAQVHLGLMLWIAEHVAPHPRSARNQSAQD